MNVAVYVRVSKDEADSKGRLQDTENQLQPLLKYCEVRGFTVKKVYTDRVSGGDSNRPAFIEMFSHVRQGHYKTIVVWSLDRFSREGITNTLSYINQLKKYNCALISIQESWLDTSAQGVGELLLSIMSWVAAEEKRKISERTKAGLERARKQGKTLGRPKGSTNTSRNWPKKKPPKKFSFGL
jgi:DNA invertase Pin-like site-specific DNA recombinase